MADIKLKDVNNLKEWNTKELRKLRMTIKNRISALQVTDKVKPLKENHPLHAMEIGDCNDLLQRVQKAEKGRF